MGGWVVVPLWVQERGDASCRGGEVGRQASLSPRSAALSSGELAVQGRPVFVERLGLIDPIRIDKEGLTPEQLLSYHLREMEFMAQVGRLRGSGAAGAGEGERRRWGG